MRELQLRPGLSKGPQFGETWSCRRGEREREREILSAYPQTSVTHKPPPTPCPLSHSPPSLLSFSEQCRDPGSNRGPSDLQSDALPAELSRLCCRICKSLDVGLPRGSGVNKQRPWHDATRAGLKATSPPPPLLLTWDPWSLGLAWLGKGLCPG